MLLLLIVTWLADVIASVADVIATPFCSVLADVIAMVVDVKTTQGDVNMASPVKSQMKMDP